eukprot:gene8075-7257_t
MGWPTDVWRRVWQDHGGHGLLTQPIDLLDAYIPLVHRVSWGVFGRHTCWYAMRIRSEHHLWQHHNALVDYLAHQFRYIFPSGRFRLTAHHPQWATHVTCAIDCNYQYTWRNQQEAQVLPDKYGQMPIVKHLGIVALDGRIVGPVWMRAYPGNRGDGAILAEELRLMSAEHEPDAALRFDVEDDEFFLVDGAFGRTRPQYLPPFSKHEGGPLLWIELAYNGLHSHGRGEIEHAFGS